MSTHEQIRPTGGSGDDEAPDAAGQARAAGVDEILDDDDDTPLKGLRHRHHFLELKGTLGPLVAAIASKGNLEVFVDSVHELGGKHE